MALLAIGSPKGGTGKTTLAANLAVIFQQFGWRVTLVDLDPQNALRHLVAPDDGAIDGVARAIADGRSWRSVRLRTPQGVEFIPYGPSGAHQRHWGGDAISDSALARELAELAPSASDLVIVETPSGEGRIQSNIDGLANVGLTVFAADAASMALLPAYRQGAFLSEWRKGEPARFGVLNQVDRRRRICRDVADFIEQHHDGRFIGSIRYDEAIAEAAAQNSTLTEFGDDAGASGDLVALARKVNALLV